MARPARELVLRSVGRRLMTYLDSMGKARAWTFLLHDVYGYELREVAEITRVSVAAAQSRLRRGRRQIHEFIAADAGLAHALESNEPNP
jgi:RNA polymerase sigma-70 factor, ECF subfamily